MAHKTVSAESRDIDALSFFSTFLGQKNFTEVKPFEELILLTLADLYLYTSQAEKKLTDIYQYFLENSKCSYTVSLCKTQSTETR